MPKLRPKLVNLMLEHLERLKAQLLQRPVRAAQEHRLLALRPAKPAAGLFLAERRSQVEQVRQAVQHRWAVRLGPAQSADQHQEQLAAQPQPAEQQAQERALVLLAVLDRPRQGQNQVQPQPAELVAVHRLMRVF